MMETATTNAADLVSQSTACKKSTEAILSWIFGKKNILNLWVTTFGFQLNQDALTAKNAWKSYTQFDITRNDDNATLNNNNMMETATTDAAESVSQSTACSVKSWLKQFYPGFTVLTA